MQRLAAAEGIAHLTHGLGLIDRLARRDQPVEELRLQLALGLLLMNSWGSLGSPEVDRTYRRAADLAAQIGNRPGLYRTMQWLRRITLLRGDIDLAIVLARKGVAMARRGGQQGELVDAHLALGISSFFAGQLAPARAALVRGLRLQGGLDRTPTAYPEVEAHAYLGFLGWLLGDEDEVIEHVAEMRRRAAVPGQLFSMIYCLGAEAVIHQFIGDADAVRADAEEMLAHTAAPGVSLFLGGVARFLRGWALALRTGQEAAVDEVHGGIEQWRATGSKLLVPYQLGLLADAQAAVGKQEAALDTLEQALEFARQTGERWWLAELLRQKGDLLAQRARRRRGARGAQDRRAALASFRKAALVARQQGAAALAERVRASRRRQIPP
jgi:tetratricopeptide (TPR) repeat protein